LGSREGKLRSWKGNPKKAMDGEVGNKGGEPVCGKKRKKDYCGRKKRKKPMTAGTTLKEEFQGRGHAKPVKSMGGRAR